MPVIRSRYWQNTTASDRNEMTRIASSTAAKTSGIPVVETSELNCMGEWYGRMRNAEGRRQNAERALVLFCLLPSAFVIRHPSSVNRHPSSETKFDSG